MNARAAVGTREGWKQGIEEGREAKRENETGEKREVLKQGIGAGREAKESKRNRRAGGSRYGAEGRIGSAEYRPDYFGDVPDGALVVTLKILAVARGLRTAELLEEQL